MIRWVRYQFLMRRSWRLRARGIRLNKLAERLFVRALKDQAKADRLYREDRRDG